MRLKNSIKNIISGVIAQMLILLFSFFTRTVFIKILGTTYLGLGSLFSNIMGLFSLAELGVGQAITFALYKAIADKNQDKIINLMKLYKKIYEGIFLLIITLGFSSYFLLDKILKESKELENVKIIYIIFVLNSAFSYLYIYRNSYIIANQKSYIISKVNYSFVIGTNIIQIIVLYYLKNYIIYLLIQTMSTIFQNIYISKICLKLYPFLNNTPSKKIDSIEKKEIFSNIKSLIFYKVGTLALNSTDNILISMYAGLNIVGIYGNYSLIVTSLGGLLSVIFNSMTASIGNLVVKEKIEKKIEIFKIINFMSFWIYSVSSIMLYILLNDFIKIWIGNQYLLSNLTIIVIVTNFYISGMLFPTFTYRQTLGLFKYGKFRPIISAMINLFISIILGKKIGLVGILLGTAITRLLTNVWYDPYIIFKIEFKISLKKYIKDYFTYANTFLLLGLTNYLLLSTILLDNNIIKFFIKGISSFIISNLIIILFFNKTFEFNYLKNMLNNKVLKKDLNRRENGKI